MKNHVMFAHYNQDANAAVLGLLNKLSNDEREKERGSYYKTLSGLVRHLGGATVYFCGVLKDSVKNDAAIKALEPVLALAFSDGALTEAQWKDVAENLAVADKALVNFCEALTDADLDSQVKWFGGNPPAISLAGMLGQLTAHNTHHRGQISQILDELKIEHNFSGINPELCI
ncbi:MAG: DinB family protein [Treponemataceae bacterium]|nr:MAG: DinB family protein [Treponemataceae bacterium]